MSMIVSTKKAKAFIISCNHKFEIVVHSTYTDPQGTLIARVQYTTNLLGHIFEVEASRIIAEEA